MLTTDEVSNGFVGGAFVEVERAWRTECPLTIFYKCEVVSLALDRIALLETAIRRCKEPNHEGVVVLKLSDDPQIVSVQKEKKEMTGGDKGFPEN